MSLYIDASTNYVIIYSSKIFDSRVMKTRMKWLSIWYRDISASVDVDSSRIFDSNGVKTSYEVIIIDSVSRCFVIGWRKFLQVFDRVEVNIACEMVIIHSVLTCFVISWRNFFQVFDRVEVNNTCEIVIIHSVSRYFVSSCREFQIPPGLRLGLSEHRLWSYNHPFGVEMFRNQWSWILSVLRLSWSEHRISINNRLENKGIGH